MLGSFGIKIQHQMKLHNDYFIRLFYNGSGHITYILYFIGPTMYVIAKYRYTSLAHTVFLNKYSYLFEHAVVP